MAQKHVRKIFVNLSVEDLPKSMEFFGKLGFEFNPQFCDENAAAMIINDDASVMLLVEPFFKTFTKREICPRDTHSEGLLCISCPSREAVDAMVSQAVAAGGTHAVPPQDMGFMYNWSFYDLDGHHWEVMWMDEQAMQG